MEIILLQDVDGVGEKHDVLTVKNGFGRNYLIPKGLAKVANKSIKKHAEEIKVQRSAKAKKLLEDMQAIAEKIEGTNVKVGAKAGASGKLFGSVTNIQLADALNKAFSLDIDRRKIKISNDIKELGTFAATVVLHKEITAEINFEVVQD